MNIYRQLKLKLNYKMKKSIIIFLFASLAFVLVSCNSKTTKEEIVTDSTAVVVDSTKIAADTAAVDTIKKVETPVVKK